MARKRINCDNCGPKSKIQFSRLTGIYWCHNCNSRLNLKREFEIIENNNKHKIKKTKSEESISILKMYEQELR